MLSAGIFLTFRTLGTSGKSAPPSKYERILQSVGEMPDLFPNIFSDDNSYLSLKDDVIWSITSYKFVVDTIDL